MRGFCDHSSFAGVGAAVPDRIELFRAQALRAVGGNAWRMAHNPPAVARLHYMDALGMMALDENRDYGGNHGQGGTTAESVDDELRDMRDLIKVSIMLAERLLALAERLLVPLLNGCFCLLNG